jgi:hypothetical protein
MKKTSTYACLTGLSLMCAAVCSGQTTITSVPYTINSSGTYLLASDLQFPVGPGNAITVDANNVTIDFGGHSLSTPVHPTGPASYGIYADNRNGITVTNGEINGFAFGIYFTYTSGTVINGGHLVEKMRLVNCNYGIHQGVGQGSVFQFNQIRITSGEGFAGINLDSSVGDRVSDNIISSYYNGQVHLSIGIQSTGSNSTVGNYYFNNLISNCSNGILMPAGGNDKYRLNVTSNCANRYFGGTALSSENN